MLLPNAPDHMYKLCNQTVCNFGYDNESNIKYSFNSLGYRSCQEFITTNTPIIVLGNTISFGLGLSVEYTFADIVQKELNHPVYNFSWGCYGHTNNDQLLLLESILKVLTPRHVIFQINNLNRSRTDNVVSFDNTQELIISEFEKFDRKIHKVLQNIPHSFLHWDNQSHLVNLPTCLVLNQYHVDSSLASNKNTFGAKSHKLIALKILAKGI
jgi:hypothetical protein